MAKQRKSKKPRKAKLEKRLAESKGLYYRRELAVGCVLLQSDYWLAMADQPRLAVSETFHSGKPISPVPSDSKDRWLAELAYIARQCRLRQGWVAHHFKAKFGFFLPWGIDIDPIPPSDEVKARPAQPARARVSGGESCSAVARSRDGGGSANRSPGRYCL
jgi:hypothetical protein